MTSVHPASDTRISHKECGSLIAAGYDVTLVVAGPAETPVPGLRVKTVGRSRSRPGRMTATVCRVLRAALREHADIYHLHDPELIPAGLVLKALRKRVIYDSHEHLQRQIMSKDWIPRPLRGLAVLGATVLEGLADRCFDGIIVANPSTKGRFRAHHTVLVENFARVPDDSEVNIPMLATRHTAVAYVGGLGEDRGLWQMIDAIAMLDRPTLRVVLAGPLDASIAPDHLEGRLLGVGSQIQFPGRLQRHEVDELLLDAQVGMCVLQPVPNFTVGHYPTKLFEYMVAGVPVIASDFPLYREVVDAAQCGFVVDPSQVREIADAIAYLLDHPDESQAMGTRGRDAVIRNYSWSVAERSLLGLYHSILD